MSSSGSGLTPGPLRANPRPSRLPGGEAPSGQEREGEPQDSPQRERHDGQRHDHGQHLAGASGGGGTLSPGPGPRLVGPVQVGGGRSGLGCGRLDVVGLRGLDPGRSDPRVVGPPSRVEGGHRPGDQEHAEQADPDPGLGPVAGPAQRVAVQRQRAGQPRAAPRPARHRLHRSGLDVRDSHGYGRARAVVPDGRCPRSAGQPVTSR